MFYYGDACLLSISAVNICSQFGVSLVSLITAGQGEDLARLLPFFHGTINVRGGGNTILGLPGTPDMGTDDTADFPMAHVVLWGYPVFLC